MRAGRPAVAAMAVCLSAMVAACSPAGRRRTSSTRAPTTTSLPAATAPGSAATAPGTAASTGTTAPSPTTTRPAGTTVPATAAYTLYFLRGSYLGVAHRAAPAVPGPATAAVTALLAGPNPAEVRAGLSSAVPPASRLLGLRIASGTATVDLSPAFATPGSPGSELDRVAQVVYTLTRFSTVSRVAFEVSGRTPTTFAGGAVSLRNPLGRSDVLGALPAILVETPAVGDSLHGSVHLSGLANVFEAQFRMQLIDGNGRVLLDQPVHATAGSGTWGSFDVTFRFSASRTTVSTLRVYDVSPRDGTPIDQVDLRLPAGP